MKRSNASILHGLKAVALVCVVSVGGFGCHDNTPPPQHVPVPEPRGETRHRADDIRMTERRDESTTTEGSADSTARHAVYSDRDPEKPLPPRRSPEGAGRPPFDDEPLVSQRPPEEAAFVDAYRRVGRPKVTLFVNRTLEGDIIPVNEDRVVSKTIRDQHATGSVDVETGHGYSAEHFKSTGPVSVHDTKTTYLHQGQYDEVQAKSLDYEAVETIMADWMAANGQITLISPTLARQRLSDQQVKELQEGRPQALSEVARQLGADVFIQVQAHPTRQTEQGLEVRIIAEAMNTKGGQSIGRAVVDVPPPLIKTTINRYTRYLARKLMDDMTATWSAPPPPEMERPTTEPSR